MEQPLLVLRRVALSYHSREGQVEALSDISATVRAGEFVCVVGPSGCGKTSLLRMIAGFLRPTAGELLVDGRPVTGPGADRGVVFQQPALYPWRSLADNIALGPELRGKPKAWRAARVAELLRLVGLAQFAQRPPYELSGGMQQRAAIARVLINEPRIMLMDEPLGALDALTRERMQEELLRIWRATGTTVILITHSVEEALYLGTRTLVMSPRPGRIVADIATPFSRQDGVGRAVRSSPDFVAAREQILAHIWQELR
ncbi:MAG TPA: ABC transporter ATP-binding protein [Roseiflexaceae bacterium]|nr:ABC transporter ATP-binding protein [Roseiflexaceae bacterium]